ncbi:sensor histidine kinase [Legionella spiritensis]|uniref:histidine kinase n=1 Tax=Legionella spiritensis TaxID=452 RepID=A0A0W0YY78_LEGSP|nr:HAMP domain-containing sensor histidine kinase [Legionella spiritensis]KTD61861.1 sensor histidine kinase CpxA [Legionella spiritensis]SNV31406.1 Sensor protein [Legionella spiritensis]
MKFNVYIKVMTAFFVIAFVFILAFFKYMKSVTIEIAVNSQKTISYGVLNSLESELVNIPKSNWDTVMKAKKDEGIYLLSSQTLKLNSNQIKKLNDGKIVFTIGKDLQFLNLIFARKTAYKKIGKSQFVLAYDFSVPEQIISYYMTPGLEQIVDTLLSRSKNTWDEALVKLEKEYGYPIHVYKKQSKNLPSHVSKALSTSRLAFETNPNTTQIGVIYYSFNGGILKIGPLKYLSITARISDLIYYFVLAFFIFVFCLITFISMLFVRNMKKIYQITENFSQGNFDFPQKISTTSVLYGLYSNIIHMGERLKELIESHKKMCRFVAHEIRTPLSTIQMTTDSIKRKNTEDKQLNKKMESIQEDVAGMNRIVSTFLIYSKMYSSEIKLRKSNTDIILWLRTLLEPFCSSRFEISLHTSGLDTLNEDIDPNILKHAVTNLISNAMKFAEHRISLTVNVENNDILIHIDDDGPGLPEDGLDDIFSEYTTAANIEIGEKHIGLGLAIVEKIVTLHNGKVAATQSPVLKGARFTITLPWHAREH